MARTLAGDWIPLAPVVGGTIISSTWANNMMNSFGADITESLDRSGRGGMLVPFRIADGTKTQPGYSWTAEQSTGFWRDLGGEDMRVSIAGVQLFRWNANGAQMSLDDGATWEQLVTNGGTGQVPVNLGTLQGQTLYWDQDTDLQWKATTLLLMDIPNSTLLMTASSTGRAYVVGAATVAVIERSADAALNIISGNINTGIINFGDTDAVSPGSIEYDHLDSKMRLYNGSATPTVTVATGGFTGFGNDIPTAQVEASAIGGLTGIIRASQWGANTSNHQARVKIQRSNSGVVGTFSGFLQANRVIGALDFEPSDGTAFRTSASIIAMTGGQQSASDTSSELQFWNTPVGSLIPLQRAVINSAGFLGVAITNPEVPFQLEGAGFLGTTGVTGHNFIAFGALAIQQAIDGPVGGALVDYQLQAANVAFNTAGNVSGLLKGTPTPLNSRFEVVAALPGGPDPDTIYFVTV